MLKDKTMPKYENKNQHPARTNPYQDYSEKDKDDVEAESEKWNPSPAVYAAFCIRDAELAESNVLMAIQNMGKPSSLEDMKGTTLHSLDVVEQAIKTLIANGKIAEDKGRYELVR